MLCFVRFASFALLVSLAAGCAATSDGDDGAPADGSASSTDAELKAASSSFVGSYFAENARDAGIARLKLSADGSYASVFDPIFTALCARGPCTTTESGSWGLEKNGGKLVLRLTPAAGDAVRYDAVLAAGVLTLTGPRGAVDSLVALGPNECHDDADCVAGQTCHWDATASLVQNGTCGAAPSEPPAQAECFGAWLDENGVCRTPADGVYPPECCAAPGNP